MFIDWCKCWIFRIFNGCKLKKKLVVFRKTRVFYILIELSLLKWLSWDLYILSAFFNLIVNDDRVFARRKDEYNNK